jgi:hypothetical protein
MAIRKCIVCGKEEKYNSDNGWRNVMLPFGHAYNSWEEDAYICSSACIAVCGNTAKQVKNYLKAVNKYPDGEKKYLTGNG